MNGGGDGTVIRTLSAEDAPGVLPMNEVHVCFVDAGRFSDAVGRLRATLSREELARAERFRSEKDAGAFIVVRGLLRALLGRYADAEPASLEIVPGPHGKPEAQGQTGPAGVRFNVSHSGGFALLAFARGREVGVDVEKIRDDFPGAEIGDRFFTPREAASIRSFPGKRRQEVFYSFWTLKEAVMKASGKGFSLPMHRFEVALDPPRVVRVEGDPDAASRWRLEMLSARPGFAAAIAVEAVAHVPGAGIL